MLQVVAMKHLSEVYEGEPVNFEMVYREYIKFSLKSSMQSFERPVVFKAFDQLMVMSHTTASHLYVMLILSCIHKPFTIIFFRTDSFPNVGQHKECRNPV